MSFRPGNIRRNKNAVVNIMVKRSGNLKINFTEIARELGVSVMTLYRVVNQSPLVSRKTRGRVIEALNRHGYFTHKRIKQVRILFDFITGNRYLRDLGEQLIKRLPQNEYFCRSCNHRERPQEFLNAVAGICSMKPLQTAALNSSAAVSKAVM